MVNSSMVPAVQSALDEINANAQPNLIGVPASGDTNPNFKLDPSMGSDIPGYDSSGNWHSGIGGGGPPTPANPGNTQGPTFKEGPHHDKSPIQNLVNPNDDHPFMSHDGQMNHDDLFDHMTILDQIHPVVAGIADAIAAASNSTFQTEDLINSAKNDGLTPGQRLMQLQSAKQKLEAQRNAMVVPQQDSTGIMAAQKQLEDHLAQSPEIPILHSPHISDTAKIALIAAGLFGGPGVLPHAIGQVAQGAIGDAQRGNELATQQYNLQRQQYESKAKLLAAQLDHAQTNANTQDSNNIRRYNAESLGINRQIDDATAEADKITKGISGRIAAAAKGFDEIFHRDGTWTAETQRQLQEAVEGIAKDSGMKPSEIMAQITHPNVNDKTVAQKRLEITTAHTQWKALTDPYFKNGGVKDEAEQQKLIDKQAEYAKLGGLTPEEADYYFPVPPIGKTSTQQGIDAKIQHQNESEALRQWALYVKNSKFTGVVSPSQVAALDKERQVLAERYKMPVDGFSLPEPGTSWTVTNGQFNQKVKQYEIERGTAKDTNETLKSQYGNDIKEWNGQRTALVTALHQAQKDRASAEKEANRNVARMAKIDKDSDEYKALKQQRDADLANVKRLYGIESTAQKAIDEHEDKKPTAPELQKPPTSPFGDGNNVSGGGNDNPAPSGGADAGSAAGNAAGGTATSGGGDFNFPGNEKHPVGTGGGKPTKPGKGKKTTSSGNKLKLG